MEKSAAIRSGCGGLIPNGPYLRNTDRDSEMMIKWGKLSPPTELPRGVLAKLDPKLARLYSQLPSEITSRISVLMNAVPTRRIHPNRIFEFAFLYVTAERSVRAAGISKEHGRRSRLELAGEIHGLGTGYRDDAEAKQRYHRGRRARQQITASLEAVVGKWQAFKEVVQKHRSELPVHVQSRYSDAILRDITKVFQNMGIGTVLDGEDLAREKVEEPELSGIALTYIWWCREMAPYRGKWNDMHQLAVAWRMSSASAESFRIVVRRICKGPTRTPALEPLGLSIFREVVTSLEPPPDPSPKHC